jgi:hypothetical protein
MSSTVPSVVAGLLLCIVPPAFSDTIGTLPPACAPSSLSSYIALGLSGCSMGHVVFYDFAFSVLGVGGGASPVAPSAIAVDPAQISEDYRLKFSSAGFSVSGNEFITYLLAYTVDPHPILTFDDFMQVDSPVFPGIVSITTNLCVNAAFAGSVCPATAASLTVFDNGVTSHPVESGSFTSVPPINVLGVRNEILLQANGTSADFSSLTNTLGFAPEPAAWLLVGPALAAALMLCRRRSAH